MKLRLYTIKLFGRASLLYGVKNRYDLDTFRSRPPLILIDSVLHRISPSLLQPFACGLKLNLIASAMRAIDSANLRLLLDQNIAQLELT